MQYCSCFLWLWVSLCEISIVRMELGMVVYTFTPNSRKVEAFLCQVEVSVVYRVSRYTMAATWCFLGVE